MAVASVEKVCPVCGKTFSWTVKKYNRKDADRWESWAEGQERMCPECFREAAEKSRAEERAAANAAAAAKTEELNLPSLTGSEKQVAWANTIRMEAYDKVCARKPNEIGMECLKKAIATHTDAAWWIDHRTYAEIEMLKLMEEIGAAMLPEDERAAEIEKTRAKIAELEKHLPGTIVKLQLSSLKHHLALLGAA